MRNGMALPAALAAVVILAGIATLANISATSAIRESRAVRDAAEVRAHAQALQARAMYRITRHSRSQLLAATVSLGAGDTTLTTTALAWPWHLVSVATGDSRRIAELARATVPGVPWCQAVVFAHVAAIAGSLSGSLTPGCDAQIEVTPEEIASFDSALVEASVGTDGADTAVVASDVMDIVRAHHAVVVTNGARVSGLLIAPVVHVVAGAEVRGLVVASDSAVVEAGAGIIADGDVVRAVLRNRARLTPLGRRGTILR